MRYWHPFSRATASAVRDWRPDHVVLLPLYPQYSTTTTGSSLTAWRQAAAAVGLAVPTTTLCCWHSDPGYAAATAALLRKTFEAARARLDPAIPLRVLFSAHGLPETIIKAGDPYQYQVEKTVAAVLKAWTPPDAETRICYQSRATPQKWIGPSTDEEVERAGRDKMGLVIVPIAFVSEHSETLVELDLEYRDLAEKAGVPGYFRVPTQNADVAFLRALASLVRSAIGRGPGLFSFAGRSTCPKAHCDCPHARAGSGTTEHLAEAGSTLADAA